MDAIQDIVTVTAEPVEDEPLLGMLDVGLLSLLFGFAVWFLIKNRYCSELAPTRTYSNQLTVQRVQHINNSFVQRMKNSGCSLVVFYGSQTGTAEEFAGCIANEGLRYNLKGMVANPDEYDMGELIWVKDIKDSLAVFCLATYGEGDPTDNALQFYEWLHNEDSDLTGLNYAVFGLGNKTYEHYNKVAKYVDRRLREMGATRIFELGLGDDDANIEEDFLTWKDNFWLAVCEYFGIEPTGENINIRQYVLTEHAIISPDHVYSGEVARLHAFRNQRPPFNDKNPFLAKVKVNRELHKGGDRSCMHIEFDIEGSKMRYEAGDHLAVLPTNNEDLVNRLGYLLNVNLDTVFTLTNIDGYSSKKHPFPCPCSYRTALAQYVDIASSPRIHVIKGLIEYTRDSKEQEKLRLMCSSCPDGRQLYNQWVIQENRSIVHILEDLPSCKPTLDHLCELLPRLQARYYSISSSPKVFPNTVHITAVLVKYKTLTGRTNFGVATNWLSKKQPKGDNSSLVPVYIRHSQFRLPKRPQTPVIMVGPGTGLAPFLGFIQERDQDKIKGKPVGDTILYFGCRKKCEDFIYEKELEHFVERGSLKMHVAFSRDQQSKVYVTHLLEQNMDEIWKVIGESNGHLYVCGDARKLAMNVHNIVVNVLQEKGGMTKSQTLDYVKKMVAMKRYSTDVWS